MRFSLAEQGMLPDPVIRFGIRRLLKQRLNSLQRQYGSGTAAAEKTTFINALASKPIADHTDAANEQHYEVPAAFFIKALGPRLKYSCALWDDATTSLAAAEDAMLALTCKRAKIEDGRDILELGCGWGSLSIWMAEHYPASSILAVSNSSSQRSFIKGCARERGLSNLEVVTYDMNDFHTHRRFHRIVSVEMFEHMRNYSELLHRVRGWLQPQGRVFVHIFCHRSWPYLFETTGPNDWMGRFFFTGGIMPSEDIFTSFPEDLQLEDSWTVNGVHYSRTLEAWLDRMDEHEEELRGVMADVYGEANATCWWNRWRIFMMACSELFRFRGGSEWYVQHYLLRETAG